MCILFRLRFQSMTFFKKLKFVFSTEKKYSERHETDSDLCPICGLNQPIIYDQNHDACTTCKSKWGISDELKAKHTLSFLQRINKVF